jgi:hypothetical protein
MRAVWITYMRSCITYMRVCVTHRWPAALATPRRSLLPARAAPPPCAPFPRPLAHRLCALGRLFGFLIRHLGIPRQRLRQEHALHLFKFWEDVRTAAGLRRLPLLWGRGWGGAGRRGEARRKGGLVGGAEARNTVHEKIHREGLECGLV